MVFPIRILLPSCLSFGIPVIPLLRSTEIPPDRITLTAPPNRATLFRREIPTGGI